MGERRRGRKKKRDSQRERDFIGAYTCHGVLGDQMITLIDFSTSNLCGSLGLNLGHCAFVGNTFTC